MASTVSPNLRRTIRQARACELRDAAQNIVSVRGEWQTVSTMRLIGADIAPFKILLRSPFTKLPPIDGRLIATWASQGLLPKKNLPWGLDIWTGKKVLNIEWDDSGEIVVVGFTRGQWEADFLTLATTISEERNRAVA